MEVKISMNENYINYFKSIIDQDRSSIVICNLKHEIVYMNPTAIKNYEKRGGEKLIGRSLLNCHNAESVKRIQEITFEAYKSSGRIAALLDQNTGPSEQLSEELERVAAQIEHGAIELRNLCARYQAPLPPVGQKPALEPLNIAGRAECNEFGWLHIQLNALLPNCRFASPLWITDTITRLLDRLERRNGKLPLLEEALLMIDEHCDIAARQVYDQDNKAWKAISNALKGRVVADDDQYSLGVCLLSRRSSEAECHIYVLPVQDAGDFFFLRSDQYPFSR